VNALRSARKLVLGETWTLPGGIAVAVLIAAALRLASGSGGWWRPAGGFVLAALLVGALAASLRRGAR
jgi:hypothetical protein